MFLFLEEGTETNGSVCESWNQAILGSNLGHATSVSLHSFFNLLMPYFPFVYLKMIIVLVRMSKGDDAGKAISVVLAQSSYLANTTAL